MTAASYWTVLDFTPTLFLPKCTFTVPRVNVRMKRLKMAQFSQMGFWRLPSKQNDALITEAILKAVVFQQQGLVTKV